MPSETRGYGLNQQNSLFELVSKTTFLYDEGDFTGTEQNISSSNLVIQHDNTNYGASFISGRGNLTTTNRHDASAPTLSISSSVKYNTADAAVAQITPGSVTGTTRQVSISYADVFNDNNNSRKTYAYPTKIIDLAGNYSQVKYRFDIGANVWAKSPDLNANTAGKQTSRDYDTFGRLDRETIINSGAYTRYEYPTSGVQSKVYSTVVDTNNNGADTNNEVLAESWTDGAGRVIKSRSPLPGTSNSYSGQLTEYDVLGQIKRSTVPTEVNSSWQPTGDDARLDVNNNLTFLWTSQEYDWKGRVTRTVNTDGTDTLASYDGCGCAGGQITTVQSETVARDDQPNLTARRKQKVYADIEGRTYKTEVMNWDGVTPYTTTVNTFNGRDQITKIRQYAGSANSSTFQDVLISYDGHGRMKTRHYPIEDAQTETTWIYNADDSIQQTIDARGAITNYVYNSRGLTTGISYQTPNGSAIPATASVIFDYDTAGNRISMSDGSGTSVYAYDGLSRLVSETKTFSGLTGNFSIGYDYQLAGKIKSITDPFGAVVNYGSDKTGRTSSLHGTGTANSVTYAGDFKYRAFGGLKQAVYGTDDNAQVNLQYDARLRVSNYEVASTTVESGFVHRAAFDYDTDGKIKTVDNIADSAFDRTFQYDQAGRLTNNRFGTGRRADETEVEIYNQMIGYNAFGDITSRTTSVWETEKNFTAVYNNHRKQSSPSEPLVYDALGNMIDRTITFYQYQRHKFDAANRQTESSERARHGNAAPFSDDVVTNINGFDGDGQAVKRTTILESTVGGASPVISEQVKYSVRSTVTGKVITELTATGAKSRMKVYFGEAEIAEQRIIPGYTEGGVTHPPQTIFVRQHGDPVTGSVQHTFRSGEISTSSDAETGRTELEPLGGIVPHRDPSLISVPFNDYGAGGDWREPEWGCADPTTELPMPCTTVAWLTQQDEWRVRSIRRLANPETRPDFYAADDQAQGSYGLPTVNGCANNGRGSSGYGNA